MPTTTFQVSPGAGQAMRLVTNAAVDSGAGQQVVSIANPDGSLAPADPDGTFQVSGDSKALFFDAFDVALANFTTGGTAPTVSGGMAAFASSTTASGSSFLRTNGTFALRPQSYLRAGAFVQLAETATSITNNTRWWGYGQNQSTPTAAAPVLNGVVFMVDYADGALYACAYSAGTRTAKVAVNGGRPTDGALHKYEIWFRQAIVYFLIDGVVVATITLPNTAVTSGMYLIAGSTNHTTAPGTAPVLRLSSFSMSDTSGTVGTLGDGDNPWIQVSVKAASTAVATTDKPLAVGLHPSSPLPAGTSTVGYVGLNPSLGVSAYSAITTAATFFALVKSSAGSLMELTVANPTTTAAFVKLYNKSTAPTSSDTPIATFRLAASGSAGDTLVLAPGMLGKRFTAGIGIGITGAAGATDATATVAGIQVSGSYV